MSYSDDLRYSLDLLREPVEPRPDPSAERVCQMLDWMADAAKSDDPKVRADAEQRLVKVNRILDTARRRQEFARELRRRIRV